MVGKIALFIGAHPDDIEFGCGGLIYKMSELWNVAAVVCTVTDERRIEQSAAFSVLGVKTTIFLSEQDGNVRNNSGFIREIADVVERVHPSVVFTHYPGDSHQDHRAVSLSVASAIRHKAVDLIYFDSFSSTGFSPNVYVDISGSTVVKRTALAEHKSQMRKYCNRGIDFIGIAETRNAFYGEECLCERAEGFVAAKITI